LDAGEMAELRTKFLNIYTNLPLNIRKEAIVLLGKEPVSWNVAYIETKGDTEKGAEILKKLKSLKIL
jgi:hypothetical protein